MGVLLAVRGNIVSSLGTTGLLCQVSARLSQKAVSGRNNSAEPAPNVFASNHHVCGVGRLHNYDSDDAGQE